MAAAPSCGRTSIKVGDRIPWLADDFYAWLRAHGVEPNDTFQVDIEGDQRLIAYQYARNEDGAKYVHQDGPLKGNLAVAEPLAVAIIEPFPPEHIEGGTA
jgi:hypothetical protein